MIGDIYHQFFYEPVFNILVGLYLVVPGRDLGVAIILLTILVRTLLAPLTAKALRSQRALQELQPKLKDLRERHKKDPQAATRAMFSLYREQGVSPMSGFLPILIQLPILFALFYVLQGMLRAPDVAFAANLYSFLQEPDNFSSLSFGGILDLSQRSYALGLFAGIAQYLQSHLSFRKAPKPSKNKGDFANMMALQMRYVFPFVLVVIASSLPAGIALYLVVTTLFAVGQQLHFNRTLPAPTPESH